MTRQQLFDKIKEKESFLCVGLDPDLNKIPKHLLDYDDPIFEFNKAIIDATLPYAVAYKPNIAFYECLGSKGWDSLAKTAEYLPKDVFKIADAKRGDIGNTSRKYAEAFFESMNFDSITVAPYMGSDSVTPFLDYKHKWVILLAATSNKGGLDFQDIMVDDDGEKLYERVIRKSTEWGTKHNLMYVVGATRAETLLSVRKHAPDHFLLVPGVGAQGGDLKAVCKFGMNHQGGLLINSSRGIIYANQGEDFDVAAGKAAAELQMQMAAIIYNQNLWV
ncbi:MAG: orotidine-5'-phosphate decarboxylase [Cyclobacteriaceae bacterium]